MVLELGKDLKKKKRSPNKMDKLGRTGISVFQII
jgi:hypothetical protein